MKEPSWRGRQQEAELDAYKTKVGELTVAMNIIRKQLSISHSVKRLNLSDKSPHALVAPRRARETLGLAHSTFYYKPSQDRVERENQGADLRDRIEEIHSEFPMAGYRTMHVYLARNGVCAAFVHLRQ